MLLLLPLISLPFILLLLPLRIFKKIKFMLVNRVVHQRSQIYGHTTPLQSPAQSFIHRHLSCMEGEEQDWSMAINFLSEDILLEILARLPVKSLLRFRSVAKSWRDMVKEPFFITKHHLTQVSLYNGNCVLTKVPIHYDKKLALLTEDEQGFKCNSLELPLPLPLLTEDEFKCNSLEFPFWENLGRSEVKVAGPCNGIVAISIGDDQLVLWNPATRECKALPPASLSSSWSDELYRGCSNFGFGIDPITKDYKLVRIWSFSGRHIDIEKAEVFSLSANSCRPKGESWRIIDDGPPTCIYYTCADEAYLNGKYYWCLDKPPDLEEEFKIVWFDMGAEVFGLIEVPINVRPNNGRYRLTVLKESCLALVKCVDIRGENKHMYEIWIMEEGGLSWTNYASVGPLLRDEFPLGFWKNEELVVHNRCREFMYETYLYNVKTHVKKKITQGVHFRNANNSIGIYNENLVSPLGQED